jgi:glycerol-3-phosphate acyltransferase PlsY
MTVLLWSAIGYACGCLPSAWLIAGLIKRREILAGVRRDLGEADAHLVLKVNAGRASWSAAAMDVLKGFTPVVLALQLTGPYEIATCAVAAVIGHCWPPFLYRFAGRGLATGAGTFLAFLPFEMVVAGLARVLGSVLRAGGLLSTLGMVAVPVIAYLRDQPMPYVIASAAINVLIFLRRLEGMEEDVRLGAPLGRVLYRRAVLDASARPVRPV